MAAWEHKYGWNLDVYYRYRKYVMANGAGYEGSDRDCADVAMSLLIDFAESHNLCLTLRDATGGTYISKATGLIQPTTKGGWELDKNITWSSKDEYVKAVLGRTSAWDLAQSNSRVNTLPDFKRDRSFPARRLSCASPAVSASRTGRPFVSTSA